MISIIIPTYNEKENMKSLIPRIFQVMKKNKMKAEVIVVDDNSPDGTSEIVEKMEKKYNVKLIKRKSKLGLSSAVVEGFRKASWDIIGVMDADFSHPPEKIPHMVKQLDNCDIVFGSRYVKGGGTDHDLSRRMISKIATTLARGLTPIKDPMSGFFFFRKRIINKVSLNPKGYKIGLEITVKGDFKKITEVPYFFTDRKKGKSKFGSVEVFNYLFHLINLYGYALKNKLK